MWPPRPETDGDPGGSRRNKGWTLCRVLPRWLPLQHHARIRRFVDLWLLLSFFVQIPVGLGSRLGLDWRSLRWDRPQGLLILSREWELNGLIDIELICLDPVVGDLSPVNPESSKAIDR